MTTVSSGGTRAGIAGAEEVAVATDEHAVEFTVLAEALDLGESRTGEAREQTSSRRATSPEGRSVLWSIADQALRLIIWRTSIASSSSGTWAASGK